MKKRNKKYFAFKNHGKVLKKRLAKTIVSNIREIDNHIMLYGDDTAACFVKLTNAI